MLVPTVLVVDYPSPVPSTICRMLWVLWEVFLLFYKLDLTVITVQTIRDKMYISEKGGKSLGLTGSVHYDPKLGLIVGSSVLSFTHFQDSPVDKGTQSSFPLPKTS